MEFASRVLLLLALGLAACADAADPPPEAWRAMTSTDSTGALRGAFLIREANGEPLDTKLLPPSLLLRCDDGLTAVYINWRSDLIRDTVAVTYALDDGPEQTEMWVASSDHQAAGRWTDSLAGPLLQRLTEHERLRTTVETAEGSQAWVFPLEGLAEASEPLREACPG